MVTNNRFSTLYWPSCGYYGPAASFVLSAAGNVWSGNVWADGPSAGRAVLSP